MNTVINIDWNEVAELLKAGDYSVRDQIREASEKMRKLSADDFTRREEERRLAHVKALKKLPPHTKVHYIGHDPRIIGSFGHKVRDGKSQMRIMMTENGKSEPKVWLIPYKSLQVEELSKAEVAGKVASAKVVARVNELLQRP